MIELLEKDATVPAEAKTAMLASVKSADGRKNNKTRSAAPPPVVSSAKNFDAFQLVVERNIFNPNRVSRARANSEEKPPRVDEISLVGTVQHDRENLALFDSPDAAFRKALREGDTLADFKVKRIAADAVELTREDKPVSLKVAQQLRRVEGGEWKVTINQAARADPRALAANGTGAAPAVDPAAPPEIPADASEILKRLMKKREKQLK